MKICSKCKIEKDLNHFHFKNKKLNTYRTICKECIKKYNNKNSENIKKRKAEKYIINKDNLLEEKKRYYNNNKEKIRESHKNYYKENREKEQLRCRANYIKYKINESDMKILEGNKGDDWIFYLLEFTGNGLHFFKYGVTSTTIEVRFRYKEYDNFNINVINAIYGNKNYIKALERKILLETIEDKFIFPEGYKFRGKTECRTNIKERT